MVIASRVLPGSFSVGCRMNWYRAGMWLVWTVYVLTGIFVLVGAVCCALVILNVARGRGIG